MHVGLAYQQPNERKCIVARKTFRMTVELESDDMQDAAGLFSAIERANQNILDRVVLSTDDEGIVRDANGNTVGKWEVFLF